MIKDRLFFSSGPLALVKAGICLLAFLTAVLFIEEDDKAYLFGIITYSCGCICDYIEIICMQDKNRKIRYFSLMLSILLGLCIVMALAMAAVYDNNEWVRSFIKDFNGWINLFLALFWTIPLENGFWLIYKKIQQDDMQKQRESNKRSVSAFDIKP